MKRKNHLLIFALALAPSAAVAQITDNLQGYWDFEGNAENNAAALGGTAFDGTLNGGATTTGGEVKVGTGSLVLNGTGAYMGVGTSVDVNEPWTVSAWFRPDIAPAGSTRMSVYETVGTYAMSYGLREGSPTENTNFRLFNRVDNGADMSGDLQVADSETAGIWHHIINSFTPSTPTTDGSLRGYLNGVLQYDLTVPAGSEHGTATGFNVGTFRSANGRWFQGAIDEVAIWDTSLDAGDAYWAYNLGDRGFALSIPERVKADNLTVLNDGGSWDGGTAPGAAEVITFSSVFTQTSPVGTGGDLTVAGLCAIGGSGLIQIDNSDGFLETGALGIDMSGGGRDLAVEDLCASTDQRWNIGADRTLTLDALSGAADITKMGTGSLLLNGGKTDEGTLVVADSGASGLGGIRAPVVVGPGAGLKYGTTRAFGYAADISVASLTIDGGRVGSDHYNYFWNIDAEFPIEMTSGTLELSGNASGGEGNHFLSPTITVNAAAVSSVIGRTVGNATVTPRMRNESSLTVNTQAGATLEISAPIVSTGAFVSTAGDLGGGLSLNGAATLVLDGENTYGGGTAINGGTLQIGDGGTTGTLGSGAVRNDSSLVFNRSNAHDVGNAISGTGSVTVTGGGVATFTRDSSYSGATTVDAGVVVAGSDNAFGTGAVSVNGASFESASGVAIANNLTLANGATARVAESTGLGSGAVTLNGASDLVADGVDLANEVQLQGAASPNVFNGTIEVDYLVVGGGAGAVGGNGVAGTSGGAGGDGLAVGMLTPTLADEVGIGEVSGSDVYFGGGGAGAPNTSTAATPGADNTGGGDGASRAATGLGIGGLGGSGVVVARYAGGPIAIGGDDIRTAGGFTYYTFTTSGADELAFGTFIGTSSATISGSMTGSGGFTWNSAGMLTLTAASTYTGDTAVNAGTLVVNGSTTSDTTVASGARLGGTGKITGDVVINTGGTHSPGNSPGLREVTGNITYETGAIFAWDLAADKDITTGGIRGTDYDAVDVTDDLTVESGSEFRVIRNSGLDFADTFWIQDRQWSDIFNVSGSVTGWAANTAVAAYDMSNNMLDVSSYGSSPITDTTLNWQAIPEPATALAGLLQGMGLLCRRRS